MCAVPFSRFPPQYLSDLPPDASEDDVAAAEIAGVAAADAAAAAAVAEAEAAAVAAAAAKSDWLAVANERAGLARSGDAAAAALRAAEAAAAFVGQDDVAAAEAAAAAGVVGGLPLSWLPRMARGNARERCVFGGAVRVPLGEGRPGSLERLVRGPASSGIVVTVRVFRR